MSSVRPQAQSQRPNANWRRPAKGDRPARWSPLVVEVVGLQCRLHWPGADDLGVTAVGSYLGYTCRDANVVARAALDPERPYCLRAACHVLPPALSHLRIVRAAAPTRIARLGVRIALEKGAEA